MRTVCARILLILLFGAVGPSVYAQTPSPPSTSQMRELNASFHTLFEAMKNGDVAVIEQYFSGPMSQEYKKLLEQNQDYPAFLRNFYKGATFSIAKVTPTVDGGMIVDVVIQLGGGSRSVTRLNAKRFDGPPPAWKVTTLAQDQ